MVDLTKRKALSNFIDKQISKEELSRTIHRPHNQGNIKRSLQEAGGLWRNLTPINKLSLVISLTLWALFVEESVMYTVYITMNFYYDPFWQYPTDKVGTYATLYSAYLIESVIVWPTNELLVYLSMIVLFYKMAATLKVRPIMT